MNGLRLAAVRLREPIMLKNVGWRSEIDAERDGVTLTLRSDGTVWVWRNGRALTILHGGLILQCEPWVNPDATE